MAHALLNRQRLPVFRVRNVLVRFAPLTLLERGLIEQVGRAEVAGRPMTYGTTPLFLEYFGLRGLEDLPAADELRRISAQKPDSLLTVQPGLATAPPEHLKQPGNAPKPELDPPDPQLAGPASASPGDAAVSAS